MEVGKAAEKGLTIYNQGNITVIDAFEKIAGTIVKSLEKGHNNF
jgi:hypothetical protein